jgi:hypothetical protein
MLSTAKRILHSNDSNDFPVYKIAHKNHPVCIWVRHSYANYTWTLDLVDAMHSEWLYRYNHEKGKQHKSYSIALYLRANPPPFAKFDQTPFAIAMPEEYKAPVEWWEDDYDPVLSYRAYYRSSLKRRFASWRKRGAPEWFY